MLAVHQAFGEQIKPFVADTASIVYEAVSAQRRVVFEGAQGTMLDLDHGAYPFVTSSHPIAGGACIGTGVGPRAIDAVLGVTKAYTSRVGTGPVPTELLDATGWAAIVAIVLWLAMFFVPGLDFSIPAAITIGTMLLMLGFWVAYRCYGDLRRS